MTRDDGSTRTCSGVSLFDGVDADGLTLQQVRAEPTSPVTHLTYAPARS